MAETHCRGCGVEFDAAFTHRDGHGPDCPGCHLCFDCAWPDCPVCGDETGVELNRVEGKVKPPGFGAVPWPESVIGGSDGNG